MVRYERSQRVQTYDSLDAKAMAIGAAALGFLALSAQGWPPLVIAGAVAAAVTLRYAYEAVRLQVVHWIEPARVRQDYLTAQEAQARLEVLDTEAELVANIARTNRDKAAHLDKALYSLGATALLLVVGLLVSPVATVVMWLGG